MSGKLVHSLLNIQFMERKCLVLGSIQVLITIILILHTLLGVEVTQQHTKSHTRTGNRPQGEKPIPSLDSLTNLLFWDFSFVDVLSQVSGELLIGTQIDIRCSVEGEESGIDGIGHLELAVELWNRS